MFCCYDPFLSSLSFLVCSDNEIIVMWEPSMCERKSMACALYLLRYTTIYILFTFILLLNVCLAFYEDEVGLFDWRHQYVGKVEFAYFDQYSHNSRRAWVATQSNVIAALNARTGSIIWRRVFEKKHGKVDLLLHHTNALISISGNGTLVRSWEPNKGYLQWEAINDVKQPVSSEELNIKGMQGWGAVLVRREDSQTPTGLATLFAHGVTFYGIKDGSEWWTWKPELGTNDSPTDRICLSLHTVDNKIYVLVKKNKILLEVVSLAADSGSVQSKTSLPAEWLNDRTSECIFTGQSYLVCLDRKAHRLLLLDLMMPQDRMVEVPLESLVDEEMTDSVSLQKLGDQFNRNEFLLKVDGKFQKLLKISKDGKNVVTLKTFSDKVFLRATASSTHSILFSLTTNLDIMTVEIIDLNDLKELESLRQTVKFDGMRGSPEFSTMYLFSKKDNELGYRLFVTFEDHSIGLLHQSGQVLWKREEALAGITSVEMIELPAATSASKLELLHEEFATFPNDGILSMFVRRVKVQIKQLEVFTASLKKRKQYDFHSAEQKAATKDLTRDQFGLHKIIVAVTDSGKLFGLDTSKGKIIWSRYLPDFSPYHLKDGKEKSMLFVQRGTAHFPLPPQCVAVGRKKSGKGTLVYAFNPLTGKPADKDHPDGLLFPYDIVQVSLLPLTDEKFSKTILLIDDSLKIHIFPKTHESITHLREKISSIYLHLINQDSNLIRGYTLNDDKGEGRAVAGVDEVWSVKIPNDQSIIKIAHKRLDEHVHSVGRVLGDRSVLYKYLNPNLIAFASVSEDAVKPSIFIYLVDGVTGQIVYQVRHRSAKGPLEIVLSENWLVYFYYNLKARRTEMSVVEIFEGFEEKNSTAFSSLDSLDYPVFLSQGYLLPLTHVNAMTVTNTERGITHKNLLLALENGYIHMIPKNLLDPRRSFQQTPQLEEEGLVPYVPELPLHPMAFVNYNKTVEKIRGIHTAAAGLESTSLVLAYGLDLYFTRVTPSRKFDVLKEDFDYIFISGVLSALILGTIISSKLASIRKLNLSWL